MLTAVQPAVVLFVPIGRVKEITARMPGLAMKTFCVSNLVMPLRVEIAKRSAVSLLLQCMTATSSTAKKDVLRPWSNLVTVHLLPAPREWIALPNAVRRNNFALAKPGMTANTPALSDLLTPALLVLPRHRTRPKPNVMVPTVRPNAAAITVTGGPGN